MKKLMPIGRMTPERGSETPAACSTSPMMKSAYLKVASESSCSPTPMSIHSLRPSRSHSFAAPQATAVCARKSGRKRASHQP